MNRKRKIMMLVLVVLVVCCIAGGAFYLTRKDEAPEYTARTIPTFLFFLKQAMEKLLL